MTSLLATTDRISEVLPKDQATGLRDLKARTQTPWRGGFPAETTGESRCRVLVVSSGKGGVGKSHYALNMAVAIAELGQRVLLLDAAEGISHLDLLCGLHSYWNLEHAASGARSIADVLLQGPANIHLLTGVRILLHAAQIPAALRPSFCEQLVALEALHDTIVVDAGTAIFPAAIPFFEAADRVDLITSSESTSIANTYAVIKHLSGRSRPSTGVVISPCDDEQLADAIHERLSRTTRTFLECGIEKLGYLANDEQIAKAVRSKIPFVLNRDSPASAQIRRFARSWIARSFSRRQSFFRLLLSENAENAINHSHTATTSQP
jgi:flagellar biosynthesis protein FlhG